MVMEFDSLLSVSFIENHGASALARRFFGHYCDGNLAICACPNGVVSPSPTLPRLAAMLGSPV
jgi:hypothetical protein